MTLEEFEKLQIGQIIRYNFRTNGISVFTIEQIFAKNNSSYSTIILYAPDQRTMVSIGTQVKLFDTDAPSIELIT